MTNPHKKETLADHILQIIVYLILAVVIGGLADVILFVYNNLWR